MNLIINNIKWLMIVSGLITSSMLLAVFAPQLALTSMFGPTFDHPLALMVVQSWGFLVFLVGVILIVGAYNAQYRNLALVAASLSKAVFVGLLLTTSAEVMSVALPTIILDSVFVLLFSTYLLVTTKKRPVISESSETL